MRARSRIYTRVFYVRQGVDDHGMCPIGRRDRSCASTLSLRRDFFAGKNNSRDLSRFNFDIRMRFVRFFPRYNFRHTIAHLLDAFYKQNYVLIIEYINSLANYYFKSY